MIIKIEIKLIEIELYGIRDANVEARTVSDMRDWFINRGLHVCHERATRRPLRIDLLRMLHLESTYEIKLIITIKSFYYNSEPKWQIKLNN